jgi:hypothetical protein
MGQGQKVVKEHLALMRSPVLPYQVRSLMEHQQQGDTKDSSCRKSTESEHINSKNYTTSILFYLSPVNSFLN